MTQKNMLQLLRYMRTLEGTKPENDEELSKVRMGVVLIYDVPSSPLACQELFANLKQVARQL